MALDGDSAYNMLYGGSSEDSMFSGSVATPSPFIGYLNYFGQSTFLSKISSSSFTFTSVIAVKIGSGGINYFALDSTTLTIGYFSINSPTSVTAFSLGTGGSSLRIV
jgi:hypothetical protein